MNPRPKQKEKHAKPNKNKNTKIAIREFKPRPPETTEARLAGSLFGCTPGRQPSRQKKLSKTPPKQNTTKRTGRDLNPRPKTKTKRETRPVRFVVFCVGGVFGAFFWRLGCRPGVHPNSKPAKRAAVVSGGLGFNSRIAVFVFLFLFGFACVSFCFGLGGFKSRPVRFVVLDQQPEINLRSGAINLR